MTTAATHAPARYDLDQVKAANPIHDVVRDCGVPLKAEGPRFRGLCPFHDERTGSFTVNPAMGIFKCFGCGIGGDVIKFVQRRDGVSFAVALESLARRAGLSADPRPNRRPPPVRFKVEPDPPPDDTPPREWGEIQGMLLKRIRPAQRAEFAISLGLTPTALERVGCGWHPGYRAFTFPMRDGAGRIVGVRWRSPHANAARRQGCIKTSINGLFIPEGLPAAADQAEPLMLCEGPTTLGALLDWGFEAVGRPNNNARDDMVADYLRRHPRRAVVIVADNDPNCAGIVGAEKLADALLLIVPDVRIIMPPPAIGKKQDARDWRRTGAPAADVLAAIAAAEPRSLSWKTPDDRNR